MPPISRIWEHFEKLNKNESLCKHCQKVVRAYGNTSNLHKHAKQHVHSNLLNTSTSSEEQSDSAKNKEVMPPPKNVPNIRKSFQRIASHQDGGEKYSKTSLQILYHIVKDMQPFNVVNGEGFLEIMNGIAPLYKVPGPKYFKQLLSTRYDVVKQSYINKLKSINDFSVTTDIWTETMAEKSYLGVTLHFVDGTNCNCLNLATQELKDRHTGDNIAKELQSVFTSWDIDLNKIKCIITDNGQNMVNAAISIVGNDKHLPCFAHTLNLVVEAGLKLEEVKALLLKVRSIVLWIKNSVLNSDKLRKLQVDSGTAEGSTLKVILDVKTRWNSTYYMLERFLNLLPFCSQLLILNSKSPDMLSGSEIDTVRQLVNFLKPFEFATREISADKYISISKVIPIVNCLISEVQIIECNTPFLTRFKSVIMSELAKRFGQREHNIIQAISCILDPRFKKMHFKDVLSYTNAVEKINELIRNEILSSSSESEEEAAISYDIWSTHKQLWYGENKNKRHLDEFSNYISAPKSPLKSNPLQIWEDLKPNYPILYKIAKSYLCIMASSVPCERLFPKAGALVSEKRNRLSAKHIDKLLFLSTIPKSDFFK